MTAIACTFLLMIQLAVIGSTGRNASRPSEQLTGWLTSVWADWGHGQSAQFFYLEQENGNSTRLVVDEPLLRDASLIAGRPCFVKVKGLWQEDSAGRMLAVTELKKERLLAAGEAFILPTQSPNLVVSGSQPWVIILCKFADFSEEPKSTWEFQTLLSSLYPGMDHFWREVSYDQIDVARGRVVGWYALPSPRSRYLYGDLPLFDTGASLADAIRLADRDVNFASYAGVTLVFNASLGPNTMAYGGQLTATLDGVRRTWRITWMPTSIFHGVYDHEVETTHHSFAHEMGHAFGLPHSSSSYGETYDSYWDLMSHWDARAVAPGLGLQANHTISYHKDMLGWIGSGKCSVPSGSQSTIELEYLSLPRSPRFKMVEIPITSASRFYTAEARSRDGYDDALFGKAVILHEVNPGRYQTNVVTGTPEWRPAHIIDADANCYTNDEGVMWIPGEVFRDEANGISISIEEETPQGFILTINHNLHFLPQFVVGGGIASTLILSNPSPDSPASGSIRMMQSNGRPLATQLNGLPCEGSLDFLIEPGGLAFYTAESQGPLSAGWVEVGADRPVGAGLVYMGLGGVAGLASSPLSTRSLMAPIDSDSIRNIRCGLALSNPHTSQVQVNVQLRGGIGSKIAGGLRVMTLGPREHVARFIDELFPAVDFSRFRGTIELDSSLPLNGATILTSPNQLATLSMQPADSISRLRHTGVVATFAGVAGSSGLVNGKADEARFYYPQGIARDKEGNIYIADSANHRVCRISPNGIVLTLAGNGTGGSSDGVGHAASFLYPRGLCVDKLGNVWVADTDNNTIRKVTPGGIVTTVAGRPGDAGAADGPRAEARFRGPRAIAVTDSGDLYVADRLNNTIRKIAADGLVTTVAGAAGVAGFANGSGSAARFDRPTKLVLAPDGDLYVTDQNNCVIRRVTPLGVVTTFAGIPSTHGTRDGPADQALFNNPRGISVDTAGAVYVCDGGAIRRISPDGFVTTLAGNMRIVTAPGMSSEGYADGIGIAARFAAPWDVAAVPGGTLYVADTNNHTVRKITVTDLVEKLYFPQFGDGAGLSSCLILVNTSITQNSSGTVEFFDTAGHPMDVRINGALQKGSLNFNVPSKGVSFFETDGLGNLNIGSAVVTSTLPVSATVLFSGPWGLAGVPAVRPSARFGIPIDIAAVKETNTGIALSNPNDSAVQVTVRLRNEKGAFVAGAYGQFEIPAKGQLARFPAEIFHGAPLMESFRGTFVVEATQPICGLGILIIGDEMATLPVIAAK